jgi:RimJ/RimL family protein N-acetyltransferase|tara:strand:+ start:9514 stop:10140 length:627 start_codon:yes stop_codon:yes gene_type:complete
VSTADTLENPGVPIRPQKPVGEVYRRHDTQLCSWISFRTLDIREDLARFNRWQNSPRVEYFWEESGSLEEHRRHLEVLAKDPHCLQLIGCFDDEPFGFFDVYWAQEDRIGPHCEAGLHDRGIHMLVGEDHHRGPHKVACWLPSLVHYLFLDEPRTQRIVSEPRSDNDRMIHHLQNTGFDRVRDFDFPHKRAALMSLSRERFFERSSMC